MWFAAGCAEYSVSFEQRSETPVPVASCGSVEMPAGIVVTAQAHPFRDDGEMSPTPCWRLRSTTRSVLIVAPVVDDPELADGWALIAVAPGTTTIRPTVAGHEAVPLEVVITLP